MQRARLLLIALLGAAFLAAPAAQGASPDVVVSQVYGGGGNSGATYQNDFVELFNRGGASVDLSGWSIQYATAAGTSWSATALSGSIAPGRHYLVQLASAAAVGSVLPTPDATGTTNLAASGGKIALVENATALTCGATAGSCSAVPAVHDLVGYGSATDFEGTGAAPALSSTLAAIRDGIGCTDTDDNSADFTAAAPLPHNGQSAAATCGTSTAPGVSAGATVDVDISSVLAISLERTAVSFGTAAAGQTPAPVGERVTVTSSGATGYALSVHRAAFTPADLPLGISSTAPAGGQLNPLLAGGAVVALPIAPAADLLIGTTSAASGGAGDVWPTSLAFTAPLPVVPPGHYSSTITYTVIAR
jgi:uncharacterized protein